MSSLHAFDTSGMLIHFGTQVLGVVIKGDHSGDGKTMDNDSTITDLTVELCWRIRLLRLGDTLQKLRLVTWETKISKFGQ